MTDDMHNGAQAPLTSEGAEIQRLAQRAIAALAKLDPVRDDDPSQRMELLLDAFLSRDEDLRHDLLMLLRQEGVQINDIIDHVLPAVARLMGARWMADQISFADVTIGTARLQEAVRALGWHDKNRLGIHKDVRTILLVIPRGEHHTLGAFVLADQWRRMGFRVELAIDQHPRQILGMLRQQRFAMMAITASGRRSLATARELIDLIRLSIAHLVPIVIGGTVLNKDIDAIAITGADHTAKDAETALRRCGLLTTGAGAPLQATYEFVGISDDRQ
jgi:methanogenic corrinoid protein MtbC1